MLAYILIAITGILAVTLTVIPKNLIFAVDPNNFISDIWISKLWHIERHMLNKLGNTLRDSMYGSLVLGIILLIIEGQG